LRCRAVNYLRSGIIMDWWIVLLAVVLFIVLSPGVLLQIPGEEQTVSFNNWRTSLQSVLVHAVVFVILLLLISWLVGLGVHGEGLGGKKVA